MNVVITMILSSNILFIIFLIIEHFKKNLFLQSYRYSLLKICLILAITPFVYLKLSIQTLFLYFFPLQVKSDLLINGTSEVVMFTKHGIYVNLHYKYNLFVFLAWFFISLVLFNQLLWKQIAFRNNILSNAHENNNTYILNILKKHQKSLNIKRNIQIYIADFEVSPFTTGVFNPIIVIPAVAELYELDLIILHELYHIKKNDSLIRFLRLIAVGIYWFNPLMFILDSYLDTACEFACDEFVTKSMNKHEKKDYGYLIIDMATNKISYPGAYITSFSKNQKYIKERIDLIMHAKKKTSKLAFLLSIGMIACSSITVFAYEKPYTIIWEGEPSNEVFLNTSKQIVSFMPGDEDSVRFSQESKIVFDSQFTDINGKCYEITNKLTARKKCKQHNYVDGIYQKHTKNSDGSCLTKSYSAKRCSQCGTMSLGSLTSETKYTKCPH